MTVAYGPFIVNTTKVGDQVYPIVKVNQQDGSFIVAWNSWINNVNGTDANQYDIYAKKISATNTIADIASTDVLINSYVAGRQISPKIAID